MIKYRPNKGLLDEAMAEEKVFNSLDEMYNYIVLKWDAGKLFTKDDLIVGDNMGKDVRIDWKECRNICTKRIGEKVYDIPQCIGMCSIEEDE